MKRWNLLAALSLLSVAFPVHADIHLKHTASVQLTVDGSASAAQRLGSSYSVSGNNITLDTAGGLGTLTAGSAVGYTAADYSITTAGDQFSFAESFTEGDATPSATSLTNSAVTALPVLGITTTTSGGTAGSLDGSIASDMAIDLTAGGAGTSAVGSIVSELTID